MKSFFSVNFVNIFFPSYFLLLDNCCTFLELISMNSAYLNADDCIEKILRSVRSNYYLAGYL